MKNRPAKYLIILLMGIYSITIKSQENCLYLQKDSVRNIFSYKPKSLKIEKGTKDDCYSDLYFIGSTFNGERSINGKATILQCDLDVRSGTIFTRIQSLIDPKETMILYYYIVTFNKTNSWQKNYYEKLSKIEYDVVSPLMKMPYMCYNFLWDNKLVILAHEGISGYYYDYTGDNVLQWIHYCKQIFSN